MKNIMNNLLQNLATRIMSIIFVCLILVVGIFLVTGYYSDLKFQEECQYTKLSTITRTLAIELDGDLHEELILKNQLEKDRKGILKDSLYEAFQTDLYNAFKVNDLKTALYTLVYDSTAETFNYGVRSDEFNDFLNEYEGSPVVLREKFNTGGIIPKYMSVNGIWLSAFHPVKNNLGDVVAVLEADIDFTEFKNEVNAKYLKKSLLILAVIIIMSLFFILYARKILVSEYNNKLILAKKNKIIEAKNRDILDSFHYAQKIQAAILPSELEFEKSFVDHFIFYQPKEVVSGDFYWFERVDNEVFIAVADCTGHGVPGSILTIICANALDFVLNTKKVQNTDEILNEVRERVIEFLAKGGYEMNDGMDIALCKFNTDTLKLQYSGAYNPIYIFSENELEVAKACKQPVGRYFKSKSFEFTEYQLKQGDVFYLFTDGFSDQFGGPKNKKYKYKHFKTLLKSLKDEPLVVQNERIKLAFNEWKGDNEQVDDVCVIGLKV